MSASPTVIVVAGANGTLGKLVCDALLSRARAEGRGVLVRGLVRKGGSYDLLQSGAPTSEQRMAVEPVDYGSDDDLRRVCAGAQCVVSTLQGLEDVIVGVQSRLLEAAIASKVRRFIPSDFSFDFTKLPPGPNRNSDLRLQLHAAADRILLRSKSDIELTSIYQGAFTELLGSGWVLFDYKKRRVSYFGSPETAGDYTTWKNTAEFTAAAALDANPTPRSLFIAGQRLSPRDAQQLAKQVTGVDFALKRLMSLGMLRRVIALVRFFKPGKKGEVMPMWVGMQYGYCMATGLALPQRLDNDRYDGIAWTAADEVVKSAFQASEAKGGA